MADSRLIQREITIMAAPKVVFNALIAPSLIKQWWYVQSAIVVPEKGGLYALAWGDNQDAPDFVTVSKISEYEFGQKLVMKNESYYSPHGDLPFDALLVVSFNLQNKEGQTVLSILQEGIPIDASADEFYANTAKGWEAVLQSLKNVAEDEALAMSGLLEEE